MAIIQNWKIRSRSSKCTVSGRGFEDGDYYFTCIYEDPESDGFIREDLCQEVWEERQKDGEPFSFWRAKYEMPLQEDETSSPSGIEKGSAEQLLQKMVDDDDPRMDKARYILAAKLEREKRLKQVDTRDVGDRRMLIYEHRKTGEVLIIADPEIRLEEVEQVQEEVVAMLDQLAQGDVEDSTVEVDGTLPSEAKVD
tara:strand:+ start:7731 stop:8318 length:588 start_codon:yes stop_codon:yes gene_type:complete